MIDVHNFIWNGLLFTQALKHFGYWSTAAGTVLSVLTPQLELNIFWNYSVFCGVYDRPSSPTLTTIWTANQLQLWNQLEQNLAEKSNALLWREYNNFFSQKWRGVTSYQEPHPPLNYYSSWMLTTLNPCNKIVCIDFVILLIKASIEPNLL